MEIRYQQNCEHVYFVKIAFKSIMVILLIVTRVASFFDRTVDYFACVWNLISGLFTADSISLIII